MRNILARLSSWIPGLTSRPRQPAETLASSSDNRAGAGRSPASGNLTTDFCIVGFPKCGTTAIARFLESSPYCHLAKLNDQYESPFFGRSDIDPGEYYVDGKLNGHKYTSYAYSLHAFRKMLALNRKTLFIFCVRDARPALLSWWNMHRKIAVTGKPAGHFANSAQDDQQFYAKCSPIEHFERYSRERLNYAERIDAVRKRFPNARILVVRQEDLARDPRAVMARIHAAMGVTVDRDYLADYAEPHQSFGAKADRDVEIPPNIAAELSAFDDRLRELIATLPPDQKFELR